MIMGVKHDIKKYFSTFVYNRMILNCLGYHYYLKSLLIPKVTLDVGNLLLPKFDLANDDLTFSGGLESFEIVVGSTRHQLSFSPIYEV